MSRKDSLGDRMKEYEGVPRTLLVRKMPVMIRLDGKAFHTYTRDLPKPYFRPFHQLMWDAALYLCENIRGARLAYVQSDEIRYYEQVLGYSCTQLGLARLPGLDKRLRQWYRR